MTKYITPNTTTVGVQRRVPLTRGVVDGRGALCPAARGPLNRRPERHRHLLQGRLGPGEQQTVSYAVLEKKCRWLFKRA